jgi:hypothetical protein
MKTSSPARTSSSISRSPGASRLAPLIADRGNGALLRHDVPARRCEQDARLDPRERLPPVFRGKVPDVADDGAADHDLLHPVGVRDLVHQGEGSRRDQRCAEVVLVDPVDERDVRRKGRARIAGRRHRHRTRGAAARAARLVKDGDVAGVAPAELDATEVEGAHAIGLAGPGKKGNDRGRFSRTRARCGRT